MGQGKPIGTMFAEVSLDYEPATRAQRQLLKDATQTSLSVEDNFRKLGVKSAAEMDLMRAKIQNSFDMIKNSSKATANDIVRAEEAKNAKLRALNEQQYGHQTSIIDNLKKHWIVAAAAIGAAMVTATQAWGMLKAGAEYDEQVGILNNLTAKYKTTADSILSDMKRASEGMIANSDLMKIALGGIAKGLGPEQLVNLANAATMLGDVIEGGPTAALKNLTEALESGRVRGLKAYAGTTIDLKASFGELESQLTDTEKAQAMYSLIMIHATKLQGDQTKAVDDTADKLDKLEARYNNIKLAIDRAFKTAIVATDDFISRYGKGSINPLNIGANLLASLFEKKGTTGPNTYEVPPLGSGAKEDPLAEYKKQIEELKKLLQARKDASDAEKKGIRDAEAAERAAKRLMDQWEQTIPILQGKIKKDGIEDFEQKLIDIQTETDKLIAKFKSIPGAVALINAAGIADMDKAVTEQARKDFEEMLRIEKDIEDAQIRRTKIQDQFYQNADPYGQKAHDAKMAQIAEEAEAYRKAHVDQVDIAKWVRDETIKYESQIQIEKLRNIQQGMASAADAFEALSLLYAEDSKERKALHDISMAFNIAEKAALAAQAVQAAVVAVATQGSGDPYTAFARIAAMAAAMAALLATIGVAFSGNGATSGAGAAAEHPAMGNSTVLGAAYGAQSESLQNSLDLLSETYNMEDTKLTKIYNELKSLNSNITGLVSSLLRTGGLQDFSYLEGEFESPIATNELIQSIGGLWGENLMDWLPNSPLKTMLTSFKYFDPLAGSISLFPKLMESMFGGSQETFIGGQGIEVNAGKFADIFKNGITAQQYADYLTKTNGGWFGDDKIEYGTVYAELDKKVVDMFSLVFKNMGNTLMYLAENLGTDIEAVLGYSFGKVKLNLMGKTGEEMSKALMEYFSNIGDQAAEDLFGDIISEYQKVNEGLLETAVRLVQDKAIVQAMLAMTNQSFQGTIPEAIKFSESLITIAGGLEKLTDAMQTYYDAFFNDAEKQAKLKDQLQAALGQYGYDLPGTRAGYRAIVESLNLTTEAGQAAYVALMNMSKGADTYYDYLEKAKASIKESDYATRAEYLRAVRGFADGGYHAGGYRFVGEKGIELEYTGPSRINSTTDTRKSLGTDELIAEVRKLREKQEQSDFSNTALAQKVYKLLDRWEGAGLPATRI